MRCKSFTLSRMPQYAFLLILLASASRPGTLHSKHYTLNLEAAFKVESNCKDVVQNVKMRRMPKYAFLLPKKLFLAWAWNPEP